MGVPILEEMDETKEQRGGVMRDISVQWLIYFETETTNIVHYNVFGFICIWCYSSLKRKKSEMPDLTCANGLDFQIAQPELENITELEHHMICPWIPFMKIFPVRKYERHFKVNGSCVNVPTSLNHVITQLPRMSYIYILWSSMQIRIKESLHVSFNLRECCYGSNIMAER